MALDDLEDMSLAAFGKKVQFVRDRTKGEIIVKQYPTGAAGSATFRHLINEIRMKKGWVPDVVYIDYINICSSSRIKNMSGVNSYTYIKTIAEELRGLAVEFDLPIITATQLTRQGFGSSDPNMDDTAESFGLPATADSMFALVSNEDLYAQQQIMVKQLKNRYTDKNKMTRFLIGADYPKMRFYDLEESAQRGILNGPKEDKPVMDSGKFMTEDMERQMASPRKKFDKNKLAAFK